jgi:hypothetical protein
MRNCSLPPAERIVPHGSDKDFGIAAGVVSISSELIERAADGGPAPIFGLLAGSCRSAVHPNHHDRGHDLESRGQRRTADAAGFSAPRRR